MKYREVIKARFLQRPNRFIAYVDIDGEREVAHVKNTGRCQELLKEGYQVYLAVSDNPHRKTKYDLIAALKERDNLPPLLINLDSQAPNEAAAEWLSESGLFSKNAKIRREVKYKNSRFDFCIEEDSKVSFLEVKGVTQEVSGVVLFPDAPTERGKRHIYELIDAKSEGFGAYILFVVQMQGVSHLVPNDEIHKAFGDALRTAHKKGVKILAVDTHVTPDSMRVRDYLPVSFD